jgi:hypothetical protein
VGSRLIARETVAVETLALRAISRISIWIYENQLGEVQYTFAGNRCPDLDQKQDLIAVQRRSLRTTKSPFDFRP